MAAAVAATTTTMTTAAWWMTHRRGDDGDDEPVWTTRIGHQDMSRRLLCEESPTTNNKSSDSHDTDAPTMEQKGSNETKVRRKHGFQPDVEGDYHGMFPARQLWKPAVEYPLWYGLQIIFRVL